MAAEDESENWDLASKRVRDEEGTVDEKVKSRILGARDRVDDAEFMLFIKAPAEGNITREAQIQGYSMAVRQYIRAILPLLRSDEIAKSTYFLEEVPIADFQVPPPNGSEEWRVLSQPGVDPIQHTKAVLPGSVPEPKRFQIYGLRNLLKRERISFEWFVELKPSSSVDESGVEHLVVDQPIPKYVYDEAVEQADLFLHNIGIGVDVGARKKDEQELNPF